MIKSTSEMSLLESQQRIHELIAHRHPLSEILHAITDWITLLMPQALVSIMRYEPSRHTLSLVHNRNFSENYVQSMQDIPVGEKYGTCGTAAHERRLIVTEDISKDTRWQNYAHLASAEGLKACWSMPIMTASNELLGTFATYYRAVRRPADEDHRCLARGAGLVALALLRHQDIQSHLVLSKWHQALFENHPDGVFTFDLQGNFLSCNQSLERITGYKQSDILGLHFTKFVDTCDQERTRSAFQKACFGVPVSYETTGLHAHGHTYPLEVTNFPVIIQSAIVGVYGICRDISERKKQECELRYLKRGMEASPHGMVLLNALKPDTPAVYANPAFLKLTGYSLHEVLGKDCSFLEGPDTDPEAVRMIYEGLSKQNDVDVVIKNYRKDGSWFWSNLMIRPVFDSDGQCSHFIGIQQDITREREQSAQIAYQATHDLLTGLINQTAFASVLEQAIQASKLQKSMLGLLYLDLDDFKPINDGLGHQTGSKVLAVVAQRLRQRVGKNDIVARMAGDEFAILMRGYVSRNQITEVVDLILETVSKPIRVGSHSIHLSVSVGIACNDTPFLAAHELLQNADHALTQAKRQGRNTWQWFGKQKARGTVHSITMRQDLQEALKNQQFELYYQPIFNTKDGSVCGVEALVRWHHPTRGLVMPGEFISLTERTGQIIPLGRWVLNQACREIKSLIVWMKKPLSVAVNISSLQFHRDGFLEDVHSALHTSGLPPKLLELEITESILLNDADAVVSLMNTLRKLGICVSIDDFGTGFSSLSYLCDLPTHKVKLDRCFVQRARTEKRMAAIVQGVITMAHHMDMIVVAEGIETQEQKEDLTQRQCDQMQGFLFAHPMPFTQLKTFLLKHQGLTSP